jgi:hypothetical protein
MFRKLRDSVGIEMKVWRNPDLKCVFVKRIKKTPKYKQHKWFKRNNTYRYVVMLNYNEVVFFSTGMSPSLESDKDVLR